MGHFAPVVFIGDAAHTVSNMRILILILLMLLLIGENRGCTVRSFFTASSYFIL